MNKTIQVARHTVKGFNDYTQTYLHNRGFNTVSPENTAWVTIHEPTPTSVHVKNEILEGIPTLQLKFWDVTEPVTDINPHGVSELLYPPNEKDANEIVRFLIEHQGKDIIANCYAGISRSGAVCKFLEDHMGYEWSYDQKILARPNLYLYNLMVHEYQIINSEERKAIGRVP